ncbi:hypothetical protein PS1_013723 [Malus domestica]
MCSPQRLVSRPKNLRVKTSSPSSGRCGIFSSSSSQTLSAELTVHAAFFSACSFRRMWQLLEFLSSDSFC